MPATANPSISDILLQAPRVVGRISLALEEIASRLEANLPGVIEEMNNRDGLTGDEAIRLPSWYRPGPPDTSEGPLNGIAIAASNRSEVLGVQNYKSTYEIVIYSIDQNVVEPAQYLRHWDRAELIRAVLAPFMTGCVNEDDRVCWKLLTPSKSGFLPQEWEDYSGIAINYTLTCDPSMNGWEAVEETP